MPLEISSVTSTKKENKNPILFVFLGASNLARSFYGLKQCITRCLFPRPVSFIHAMGPGRAYIAPGGILNTIYDPILKSEIIEEAFIKREKGHQVIAFITDIGNDVMYGIPEDKIIEGLKSLITSLNKLKANIFITSIPVDLKNEINKIYFRTLRQIFFRNSTVEHHQALEAIEKINNFIVGLQGQNIFVLNEMKYFCGLDKIHYSLLKSQSAWSYIAYNLTKTFNIKVPPKLTTLELVLSLLNNMARILFTDLFKLKNKSNDTF